ncbi:hypothetical protein [Mucilaginibacter gotjawali]|uniref:hypothetical protein n=1 Tax=Mucilaginibacter gotjawali TaxID=1550579 RepID=UPI000BBA8A8D|nr:hypothetical protein [Mucilaginibacter gotjawali]
MSNLLSKKWGQAYYMANQEYNLFNVVAIGASPKFTFDNSKLNSVNGRLRPYTIYEYYTKWRALLNISYNF